MLQQEQPSHMYSVGRDVDSPAPLNMTFTSAQAPKDRISSETLYCKLIGGYIAQPNIPFDI